MPNNKKESFALLFCMWLFKLIYYNKMYIFDNIVKYMFK